MSNNYVTSEQEGIELLYRGRDISTVPFSNDIASVFNDVANTLELEELFTETEYSKEFNIPQHYKDIDVEEFLLTRAVDRNSRERVEAELAEFKARNMYPVLQLMIYIVDTMRNSNVVWGVGRGSAVSSYVLFLIGIHKVDAIKYNLDIKEFLK